jgi:hypothetical protein
MADMGTDWTAQTSLLRHDSATLAADARRDRHCDRPWCMCAPFALSPRLNIPEHHRKHHQPDKRYREQDSNTTVQPLPSRVSDRENTHGRAVRLRMDFVI